MNIHQHLEPITKYRLNSNAVETVIIVDLILRDKHSRNSAKLRDGGTVYTDTLFDSPQAVLDSITLPN